MSPEYFLKTNRLQLRRFTIDDLHLLFELNSDPDVMKYIRRPDESIEETHSYFNERIISTYDDAGFGVWALELLDGTFAGFALLITLKEFREKEVGYRLHKKFWNNGYATEIANALVEYGFDVCNLNRIVGITHPENLASQHVLEKCGLRYERDELYQGSLVKLYAVNK